MCSGYALPVWQGRGLHCGVLETEITILGEDCTTPAAMEMAPDACGSSNVFLLLRSGHRQVDPQFSAVLVVNTRRRNKSGKETDHC